jgi:predicted phosphate transport protein (TIGR00153 family)
MPSVQGLIRWLVPREDHFFAYLERQVAVAHEAALALATLADGRDAEEVAREVAELEQKGDTIVREMEEALAKTFVTPIDREDLQRICQELDDIPDMIDLAARYFHIYRVPTVTGPMRELLGLIVDGATQLKDALPSLRGADWPALMEVSRSLRTLEKKGDEVFRTGVSQLFDDETVEARDLLRQKEVLEDLESAIDRCERVGNTLAMFSIKHG